MEDAIRLQQEYKFRNPPITAADRDKWPQITRKDAGSLTDGQILLGPTEAKAVPYKHVVFGDAETMQSNRRFICRINDYTTVSLSSNGKLVAAATGDMIVIWRLQDGLAVQWLERDGHTDIIRQIGFSPDSQHIVSAARDKLALVWNVNTGDVVHRLEGHEQVVKFVLFSPNGTQIATRSSDSELRMWSASSGNLLYAITDLRSGYGGDILFSPDGAHLAADSNASQDDTAVVVMDCRTGERIATLRKQGIYCMAFSPGGGRIATGSKDGSTCVWDAASGKALFELKKHADDINGVAFAPDGGEVATVSDDGTVVMCDSRTGERGFTFRAESVRGQDKEPVQAMAYSPRNDFIAWGANDGCVRVWNRTTGAFVATFYGHTGAVWWVMFTPDGWDILSHGADEVVRLWSVRDALCLS
ncbi:WD40 repeat domain-containing protein [Phanerochaete sordida]|uniref:WD40 repeat domain-containing protein n=1 Tax=Phanerochaete sordida TaxID=48140 RepID=A0A9P3GX27_9APHY|nr:WD40 repeat domain-containing protein [Phanerochaete sordida]